MIIAERKKSQTPRVILKMKKKRINVHEWTNKKHKNEAKSSGGRLLNSIKTKEYWIRGRELEIVKQKAPHTRTTIVRDHNLQFCKCSDLWINYIFLLFSSECTRPLRKMDFIWSMICHESALNVSRTWFIGLRIIIFAQVHSKYVNVPP